MSPTRIVVRVDSFEPRAVWNGQKSGPRISTVPNESSSGWADQRGRLAGEFGEPVVVPQDVRFEIEQGDPVRNLFEQAAGFEQEGGGREFLAEYADTLQIVFAQPRECVGKTCRGNDLALVPQAIDGRCQPAFRRPEHQHSWQMGHVRFQIH